MLGEIKSRATNSSPFFLSMTFSIRVQLSIRMDAAVMAKSCWLKGHLVTSEDEPKSAILYGNVYHEPSNR